MYFCHFARFSCSFSNFCFFYGPLGFIKHKNFAAQFFTPPSVFFWPLENRQLPKIGKKSKSIRMIKNTTFHMNLGSRNLIKLLFWWSEVNFCHKGHLKVIWGHLKIFCHSADFHVHFLIFAFYDSLGSIKHKNFGVQFFYPPSVFFRTLENRHPQK